MVRNYKKKRTREEVSEDEIAKAVKAVEDGMPYRTAADLFGIKHTALFYRVKKNKESRQNNDRPQDREKKYASKYTSHQVFSKQQEEMLCEYVLKCSAMKYGMSYSQVRVFAYDYATKLGLSIPENWIENKTAGVDWVLGFMRRHKQLSLRKPENTSLSRATSFNKTNVDEFFNNYERALTMANFTGDKIYNLDETGVSTVVQAPNVIAKLGARQVGQAVSGERGSMITICMIVSAIGNRIPPVFIFPRAKFHPFMLNGAPEGSLGLANSPKSGWMTGPLFLEVLKHIQKYTNCSKDNRILILMDNHETHCTIDSVLFARDNGIVFVTFPPHCSHRMQPLDVSVLGPFKGKLKVAQNDWLVTNPGKTITIHDLAGLTKTAYNASFTPNNICSGFRASGTWPFNRLIFTDDDFASSYVTDRPTNSLQQDTSSSVVSHRPMENISAVLEQEEQNLKATPTTPGKADQPSKPIMLTPEDVRPFPKAAPRVTNRGRRKGKSRILTETPEKNRLEDELKERVAKASRSKPKRKMFQPEIKIKKKKVIGLHLMNLDSDNSEDWEEDNISLHDESECEDRQELINQTNFNEDAELNFDTSASELGLTENDFVLVEFSTKKTKLHYVGLIEKKHMDTGSYIVKFMRRRGDTWKFNFPEKEDIFEIEEKDIKMKLPQPTMSGGTARAANVYTFPVNFSTISHKIM